ncbi:hypothetical protein BUE80_DR003357 [Diplocarpon rosae]|nr:hypothetical protein BUE80_DR003357 [Diplocarpon rosae]
MSSVVSCLCRSGLSPSRRRLSLVQITRRLSSSSLADSVAADFLSQSQSADPSTQIQSLDANQLQRLSATLSRPELAKHLPQHGTPLPAGYHLAYFTPSQVEDELGRDGTDTTFNPPSPFTRRMWAGGELEWVGGGNQLRIGQEATETTRLTSAVGKKDRAGGEMVIVGVEKILQNEHGVVLVDKRNWIFRPEIELPLAPASKPAPVPFPEGTYVRDFNQTPVTLFRFSALTFNAHKIHYSREWCEQVEGHRNLVVHGPLNLINILNFWRDVQEGDSRPKMITYRATSPLYVSEDYRIIMQDEVNKVTEVKVVDSYGQVSMKASIESF